MPITPEEVFETLNMVSQQNLRHAGRLTMGISLAGCADEDLEPHVHARSTTA